MIQETTNANVAIYWDFENIHACLLDREEGDGSYYRNRFRPQSQVISISPIVNYALSFGDVVVHKAYCNWQFYGKYSNKLNRAGMDLIQIYPRGKNAKNGADISLALDALIDAKNHSHITHVMVISNDTDFVSLAQRLKQMGKKVIGVGLSNANRFWKLSCTEFKQYEHLIQRDLPESPDPSESGTEEEESPAAPDPARTLSVALNQLSEQYDSLPIPKPALKTLMRRLDPSFDESALDPSYQNFTEFLRAHPDVVMIVDAHNISAQTAATEDPPTTINAPPASPERSK